MIWFIKFAAGFLMFLGTLFFFALATVYFVATDNKDDSNPD